MAQWFNSFFQGTILIYMGIVIGVYLIMLLFALVELYRNRDVAREAMDEELQDVDYMYPLSILVPAYNESVNIINTVQSLLSSNFPQYEIIIINDGSKDDTLDVAIEQFQMKKIKKVVQRSLECKEIRGIYQSEIDPRILLIDDRLSN